MEEVIVQVADGIFHDMADWVLTEEMREAENGGQQREQLVANTMIAGGEWAQRVQTLQVGAAEIENSGDKAEVPVRELQQNVGNEADRERLEDCRDIQGRFGSVSPRGTAECRSLRSSALLSDMLNLDSVAVTTVVLFHSPKGAGSPGVVQP